MVSEIGYQEWGKRANAMNSSLTTFDFFQRRKIRRDANQEEINIHNMYT